MTARHAIRKSTSSPVHEQITYQDRGFSVEIWATSSGFFLHRKSYSLTVQNRDEKIVDEKKFSSMELAKKYATKKIDEKQVFAPKGEGYR